MPSELRSIYLLGWAILSFVAPLKPAWGQSIVPRNDTNTIVSPDGNTLNITGGRSSGDGANLFHSFERFGLDSGQIANFVSNPTIRNILGRINGGEPSIINGLIQITGGNSNLFLMNPAGIVFGSQASLNVPGSFMATTADRIGFGNSEQIQWFYSNRQSNYSTLVGTPNHFAFTLSKPGATINAGNLAVSQGQNLILLGGTLLSTGTLSAPGGQIVLSAVPGESLVRISQSGNLLSLDVEPRQWPVSVRQDPTQIPLPMPLSLPELLTGPAGDHATGVSVNNDGTVELTGSGVRIENGDVVLTDKVGSQTAILQAEHEVILAENQLETTGDLNLLAKDTVRLRDTSSNPTIVSVGGDLQIRGDRAIDIAILNHPDSLLQSGGDLSFLSDGTIDLNAHITSGGNFSVLDLSGNPSSFQSTRDLILTVEGDVLFADYTGPSLQVDAAGTIEAGTLTLTESETSVPGETTENALTLNAGATGSPNPGNSEQNPGETPPPGRSQGNIVIGEIAIHSLGVLLTAEATGRIEIEEITSNGGNINLTGDRDVHIRDITSNGGNINLTSIRGGLDTTAGTIDASSSSQSGGSISLNAQTAIAPGNLIAHNNAIVFNGPVNLIQDFTVTTSHAGEIRFVNTVNGDRSLTLDAGTGNVVFERSVGFLTPVTGLSVAANTVEFRSSVAAQGSIHIDATGTVTLRDTVTTRGFPVTISGGNALNSADIITNGGHIELTSETSQITTGNLDTSSAISDGGKVTIAAYRGILSGSVDTHSKRRAGGDVSLTSNRDDIEVASINAEGISRGGQVAIETPTYFRALDSFVNKNGVEASISTAAEQGGEVAIAHGGTTFEVGDANGDGAIPNGIRAAITTGSGETISADRSFSGQRIRVSSVAREEPTQSEESTASEESTDSPTPDSEEEPLAEEPTEPQTAPSQEEATTEETPTTAEQPTEPEDSRGTEEPTTGETPVAEEPTTGETPVAEEPPTAEEIPATAEQPTEPEDSRGTEEPTTEETPATGELPTVEETPVTGELPTVEETPAVPAPEIEETPASPQIEQQPEAPPIAKPVKRPEASPIAELPKQPEAPILSQTPNNPQPQQNPQVRPNATVSQNNPQRPDDVKAPVRVEPRENPKVPDNREEPEQVEVRENPKAPDTREDSDRPEAPIAGEESSIGEPPVTNQEGAIPQTPITQRILSVAPPPIAISPANPIGVEVPTNPPPASSPNLPSVAPEVRIQTEALVEQPAVSVNSEVRVTGQETANPQGVGLSVLRSEETPPAPVTISPDPAVVERSISVQAPPTVESEAAVPRQPRNAPVASPGSAISADPIEMPVRSQPEAASLPDRTPGTQVPEIENLRTREFSQLLGVTLPGEAISAVNLRGSLATIARETNLKPAVVYAIVLPEELQLIVVTADGMSSSHTVTAANREALQAKVREFLSEVTDPRRTNTKSYMHSSLQLYEWLIAPIEQELEAHGIDTLMFSLDPGLRAIPLAALHDGQQFLIEKYRVGLIPSITLTDARYNNLKDSSVLAMGASEFKDSNIRHLPAVPIELGAIARTLGPEKYFVNEEFTAENLRQQRSHKPFEIVHLATHVQFYAPGDFPEAVSASSVPQAPKASREASYIQFWDSQVPLENLRSLGFDRTPVELLVLSACDTAVGNPEAELGFAGLAVKMGVKSVLASLWKVDDDGTLALMSEFYQQLSVQQKTIKAEALRQAQLGMIAGEVRVEGGRLMTTGGEIELPPEMVRRLGDRTLSHPYFWASFTLIGTPW